MSNYTKWVAAHGNAISISDQKEAMFAKNVTLRYPLYMPFDGDKVRITFSNLTGTEDVTLTKVRLAAAVTDKKFDTSTLTTVTFGGSESVTIKPGECIRSDEIDFTVKAGEKLSVMIYLKDYTQLNSGVLITGPLSTGFYSYGDFSEAEEPDIKLSRKTNWYFFMETVDVRTSEDNHALVCYGDSITAQSWPDYLTLKLLEEGVKNVSVIRRAVSGTRILREYDNITYAAYGLKGEKRFQREIETAGADMVIIQHGINDIIHPVGVETNPFRPWEDLPTTKDMINGVKEYYLPYAKARKMKVFAGTLLPIKGWRTYADFRDELKDGYNEWLRTSEEFDDCIDFDKAVRNEKDKAAFGPGYDSGDHLHPSEAAYKRMAEEAYEVIWGSKRK